METIERIKSAAIELFAEKGYDAVSVRMICEKANANISAVNYYYQTKEHLLVCIIKDIFELFSGVERAFVAGKPIENICSMIDHYLKVSFQYWHMLRLFQREQLAQINYQVVEAYIHLTDYLVNVLQNCISEGIELGKFRKVSAYYLHCAIIGTITSSTIAGKPSDNGDGMRLFLRQLVSAMLLH